MEKTLYDLTNPQKLIWFTEGFYKGTSIENITGTVIVPEKVNFSLLEQAINIFVEKSDSFRLKFVIKNNKIQQYVEPYSKFPVEIINITSDTELEKVEKDTVSTVFNVLDSFLYIFKIVRFPDGHGGFIINMHHLISDAWSAGLGGSEIIKIYTRLLKNEGTEDISYPSYIDYINSEREYLNSDRFSKDKAFWNDIFETVPEIASIPGSGSVESKDLTAKSQRKQFTISNEFLTTINEFCKNSKVSMFNFFMAVFSIYIGRTSDLDEFVIGTPVLNRSNIREKRTSGMFINTVPVKISLKDNIKFADLASSISSNLFNIFKHQKYSYLSLLEDLRHKNNKIPNLYNFLMSYQNVRSTAQTSETPFDIQWIPNEYISEDMDIHIYDMNDTGNINIAYDYQTAKYTEQDILKIHERILHIINQILENNDININDLEIIIPKEKQQLLVDFNSTSVVYDNSKTISMLFEEQALKTPNRIALVFEDKEMTYKELNAKSNSLAHYIRSKGIGRNDIVGIMVNRSLEMIISILAVLKSGATYIPIDPEYPQDRIEYMLDNSSAKLLLTFKTLQNKVNFNNMVFVNLNNNDIYSLDSSTLPSINTPDDSSYIIYTSGSTGMPKGVVLTHKALTNLTNYCNNYISYLKDDKYRTIVSVTTVCFDIFIFETLISLQRGLKLVIANENEQNIPRLLNTLIEKHDISIIQTTPSRMQLFVNNYKDIPSLSNLKFITLAGEQLPLSLVEQLKDISGATIYNGYGPSETTVFSTLTDVTNHKQITIGKPLYNTQIYLLDKTLNSLPIGCVGELYISGEGLGKGYLNNLELTQKSFIANPFIPGTLMYKTGDLGTYRPDGEIVCLGRCDNQVKIRGLRIELEEIEHRILDYKNIDNCVVVKKVDNNSHEFLCAYYTANSDIDLNLLRAELSQQLPNYMVPQYFVELEKLPYTPNGKINRKLLPMPNIEKTTTKIVLPRNDIDSELINILKDLINIKEISIDDSFFDLGGDSLTAINLCSNVYNKFSVQISVRDIFENPIIQDLSDVISSKAKETNVYKLIKAPELSAYPVSSAQKRIYFSSIMAGENSIIYNVPGALLLDDIPDVKKLENCFQTLISRHESLRTFFELENDVLIQKIKDTVDFKLDFESEPINISELKSTYNSFTKSFDLSKAPLMRIKLVKVLGSTDVKAMLLMDIHHIICDGTSLQLIVDELCKLYNNQDLPNLNITYKDFAWTEKEMLSSGSMKEAEEYWVSQFKDDIPVLEMPTNFARPATQSFVGKKFSCLIDKDLTSKIESVSKSLGTTPYMLTLAAYYILLYKYSAQDNIVVGSPISGRDLIETNNLIGMFVNTLAIKANIDSKLSFKEFLDIIKEKCLNSYKYQTYPFDELVNKLSIKRDSSRNPLFDTLFTFQNTKSINATLGNITGKPYSNDNNICKFDLSLEIIPKDDTLDLSFEYATKLFKKDFIQNLSNHYINILNAIVENATVKIADICMLSDNEKDRILNEFNNTSMDFPKNKTIIQIFEEQVKNTPNLTAIVFENQKLTYKQLNEKANSLAHHLKSMGINRNSVVGIMVKRSLEMIVSIIAVLKAGGTYILIDNTFPADRVKYILTNSESSLLIADNDYSVEFDNQLNITDFNYSKNTSNLKCENQISDSFAIIYTSGSTGNPKGVLLKQSGLINLIHSFDKLMDIGSFSSHLGLSSVSFDMFAVELYTSILLGRTLYLLNDEEIKNPVLMSNIIIDNNVEFLITTPTKIELLLANPDTAKCLKTLKAFQLGGEVFLPSLYEKLSKYTDAKIYNGYGPTEITACCTNKLITSKDNINIGTPIPNTQIYILDNDLNICPINVPGELCVAGDGVSLGYINDKTKTKKVFVNTNFNDKIIYKTGDIAKINENGEIEYIGRNDFQVKLNGLRIELSEIEKKFLAIKEIQNCVVLCDKTKTFLKAFFTATDTLSIPAIRKKLAENLPLYMVPKYIFQIETIPMTSNGKVDRKVLDEYKTSICEENITYVEPETELQKLFCDIWSNILETTVGIDNDLFELGADSLSAIRFKVEALNNNIDVPYADIFKYKTIRKLSESKAEEAVTTPIENLDYTDANIILKKNRKQFKYKVTKSTNNNILLFGCNGFVGMHIIDSFIKNDKGTIYCVMRDKNGKGALNRFSDVLHFYFGDSLDKYIGNRIIVLKGDIVKENFGLSNRSYETIIKNTSTIINAAANVKHFGNFDKFKSINIDAISQTIEFCKKYSKRLIHLSTLSISGNMFIDGTISNDTLKQNKKIYFAENNLFINQSLDNVYTRSKFEAEKIILDNISTGLDAQILRLGNITSRASDGKFQVNADSNAFTNRLKSFVLLKMIPKSLLKQEVEFTAVDSCSDAIIKVLQNKNNHISVLHLYNRNHTTVEKILKVLKELKFDVKAVKDDYFADFIQNNLSSESIKDNISGIINDLTIDKKLSYSSNIYIKSNFSVDFLLKCKFKWNKINKNYITKYINYFRSIDFFVND